MERKYEIDFRNITEEDEDVGPFSRILIATSNSEARSIFKREMKEDNFVYAIEGRDYKIDSVYLYLLADGINYDRYRIGYKEGENVFFTGKILTAKNEKNAVDKFMRKNPNLIRKNVIVKAI